MSDTAWLDDAPEAKWLDDAPDAPQSPQVQMGSSHRMETDPSHRPSPMNSARASVIGEEPGGFGRGVARGGWAIPGLLGLDYETAAGVESAVKDPANLEKTQGLGFMDRVRWYRDAERERSRRGEAENPVKTGLGIGAGSAPSSLLLPQAKVAEGAGLGARALASATTAGAQSAAIEGGVTGDLPVGPRLARMGGAAASGVALGALAPIPSNVPTQEAIDATAGVKVPEPLVDYLRRKGGERNIKAAGGIQSDIARARKQVGRDRLNDVGAEFSEYGLTGATSTPAKTYERAIALQAEAGQEMRGVLAKADQAPEAATTIQDVLAKAKAEILDPLQRNPHTSSAPDTASGGGGGVADRLTSLFEKYAAIYGDKPVTPSTLHEMRSNISKDLYGLRGTQDPWANGYKEALHDFRSLVSGELSDAVERSGQSSAAWKAANRKYEVGARAEEFADKGMDRTHGNSFVSPMEGLVGSTLAAGGLAAGHGGAGAAGALGLLGTALARRHGSGALGKISVSLSNALKADPAQFGPYAQPLLAAAERGPEALAAAHYLLSNSSVEYRARWASVSAGDEGDR